MFASRRSVVAPPGPAWAGSLMGTAIFATLSHLHNFDLLATTLAAIAVGIAVFITAGWLRHRNPAFHQQFMAPWGMYAMGIMALGSALAATTGQQNWQLISWVIGAPLAVYVCINQLRKFSGEPTFQWALALVSPMVAATSGAQLGFRWVGAALFFLTLLTALPVFTRVYLALGQRKATIPPQLGGTAWIPLGVVGQSTAAAQLIFSPSWAVVYGTVMLVTGVLPVVFAMFHFGRTVFTWAGYSPGWWGSTFPVGTVSLGLHLLAETTGVHWLDTASLVALGLLGLHWLICVSRYAAWFLGEHHPAAR